MHYCPWTHSFKPLVQLYPSANKPIQLAFHPVIFPFHQDQMIQQKSASSANRTIAKVYKIVKPLFQVRAYFYAQVCCVLEQYKIANAALYVYENEDPSQSLKMLTEKLGPSSNHENSNLIFPYRHIKDTLNEKNISLFLIQDCILPLQYYEKRSFSVPQFLEILHGALNSLSHLHFKDIVHRNISLNTAYLTKQKNQKSCKFALNILDTAIFTQEDALEGMDELLFESEAQSLGQKATFKDDLESLVYVLVHLVSKGKMFTVQRYQLQWVTEFEFQRWKSCEFFKEMIKIIPKQLEVLVELYTIAKSLRREEKPDYMKLIKKVVLLIGSKSSISPKENSSAFSQVRKSSDFEILDSINVSDISVQVKGQRDKQKRFKAKGRQNQSNFHQTNKAKAY